MSGAPSPLRSATATTVLKPSAAKRCASWNVPSPRPNSTNTGSAPMTTARSSAPSRLKSPAANPSAGRPPTAKSPASWNVPSPLPRKIDTPWLPPTARSGPPSPLKSPTIRARGRDTANGNAGRKVPSPLPRSTEMLLEDRPSPRLSSRRDRSRRRQRREHPRPRGSLGGARTAPSGPARDLRTPPGTIVRRAPPAGRSIDCVS